MYCANCGLKLPDWAHYCERCGARQHRTTVSSDPLDRVGLDDTSASEPLWIDESGKGKPSPEPEPDPVSQMTQPMDGPGQMTQPMDALDSEEGGKPLHARVEDAVEDGTSDVPKQVEDVPEQVEASERAQALEGETQLLAQDLAPDDLPSDAKDEEDAPEEQDLEGHDERDLEDGDQTDRADGDDGQPVVELGEAEGLLSANRPIESYRRDGWPTRQRASERYRQEPMMSMKAVAIAAAAAIALGFGVSYMLLGLSSGSDDADTPSVVMEHVSRDEATKVITSLNGWWTTDRTYDGRYWYLQGGIMETYAADGQLAKQILLDVTSVERMAAGPGGIEGAGYFLRDIAFFLRDEDPDTLHAIDSDGSTDEDANLFRTDPPAFAGGGSGGQTVEDVPSESDAALASEYVLPESSTRVYDISELEPLSDHDLFVARNEIYARHGYVFEAGELSEYFSSKSWYHPSDVFNEGVITEIERENVSNILSIEQARNSPYV